MIKLKIKYGNDQTDLRFPCTEKDMVRVKGNGAEGLHRKPTGTAAAVAKQGIQIRKKYGDSRGDETESSDR